MRNETRRARRLRRAPKIVLGNDNSESIADRHTFPRVRIASRFQASTASARLIAEIALASGRSR